MATQSYAEVSEELEASRLGKLDDVRRSGRFIGSVWAYHLEEGEPIFKAQTLWTPYAYDVDSGRLALHIKEWAPLIAQETAQQVEGTGELERGRELLMGIFQTMVARGTVTLLAVPESTVPMNEFTAAFVANRDSRIPLPSQG